MTASLMPTASRSTAGERRPRRPGDSGRQRPSARGSAQPGRLPSSAERHAHGGHATDDSWPSPPTFISPARAGTATASAARMSGVALMRISPIDCAVAERRGEHVGVGGERVHALHQHEDAEDHTAPHDGGDERGRPRRRSTDRSSATVASTTAGPASRCRPTAAVDGRASCRRLARSVSSIARRA